MITTNGIVIREKNFGENDKFIDILTDNYGVIEIMVKGSKKINSQNSSSTQLFAYSKFCLESKKDKYYLNSCEPIKIFYDIRLDIDKLSLVSYFSELISFTVCEDKNSEILKLFLNTIHFLSIGKREEILLKSIFELRLMAEIGMMPNVVACGCCNIYLDDKMFFVVENGGIYCHNCYNNFDELTSISLTDSVLHALRYILLSDFNKIFNFTISPLSQNKLAYISESYLLSHLGRKFKTLDFYKSIKKN
jgi:DNA repair protein RecO (recombination protein O)